MFSIEKLSADVNWARIAFVLLVGVGAWFAFGLLMRGVQRLLSNRVPDSEDQKRIETLKRSIGYVFQTALLATIAVLLLAEFGISIAPILGAAGVVGIAAGFAAQSLVKDFFRGVFLLIENQIRVGDVVEVAGKSGVVEEVTLRYVRLRNMEGNVHFVPNGEIGTVTNMSLGFAFAVVDVPVSATADLDRVVQAMREVAQSLRDDPEFGPRITEPFELIGVDQWEAFSVVVRGRLRTLPMQQWGVKREFLRRVKPRLIALEVPLFEPMARMR
ncbi:MAG: mechanosensitive ion channel family protein [Lautropia sp.]